jgi:hypothetical protein
MATAAHSPNDLTRQQLDELDALLQRMLSLPLNPPDSFAPSAAAPAQPYAPPMPMPAPVAREAPLPVQVPAPRVFTPPASEPAEMPVPWKASPAPAPAPIPVARPAPAPVAPPPVVERPAPFPAPAPAPEPTLPFAKPLPPAPAAPVYVAPPPEPVPVLLAPLVGFNAALNWSLGLLGMPGRVLRSGFVKGLFGLAGLGLLAYTGLKVAQIHGLVTLPAQLPWPR